MSILVKMDMPDACCMCPFQDYDREIDGCPYICTLEFFQLSYLDRKSKRHDNCPLIEIPPHGDLVDKQQMAETNEQHYLVCKGEPNADYAREVVLRMLDQAPTIIEAEVKE